MPDPTTGSGGGGTTFGQMAEGAAMNTASGAVGYLLGEAFQGANGRYQVQQQQKLDNLQEQENEKQATFNQALQMKTWQETNYPAQMQELEQAGLNPGLIYGQGGGGGQTSMGSGYSESISGAQAPQGGNERIAMAGLAQQGMMQEAQMNQMNAQANLANAEAKKISGVDTTNTQADTNLKNTQVQSLTAGIDSTKATTALTKAQTTLQNINNTIASDTQENVIAKINTETQTSYQILRQAQAAGDFDQASLNDRLNIVTQQATEAILKNTLLRSENQLTQAQTGQAKSQTALNEESINKMAQDITNSIAQIGINQQGANAQTLQAQIQNRIQDMPVSKQMTQQAILSVAHDLSDIYKILNFKQETPQRN